MTSKGRIDLPNEGVADVSQEVAEESDDEDVDVADLVTDGVRKPVGGNRGEAGHSHCQSWSGDDQRRFRFFEQCGKKQVPAYLPTLVRLNFIRIESIYLSKALNRFNS